MKLRCTFATGLMQGQSFEFRSPRVIVLGRAVGCDLKVFDERVSRRHATIMLDETGAHLADLSSANGTFIAGKRVTRARLADGDRLKVADTEIEIELAATIKTARLERTMPPPGQALPKAIVKANEREAEIAGYELGRCLGEGGAGAVFEGRSARGDLVAIKVIKVQSAVTDEDRARFIREASIASSLTHPNLVRVVGHGEAGQRFFLIMEYVEGATLKARVEEKGPGPVTLALHVTRQIASALELARERDIVHRDVKPDNILITQDGVAKLTDFGLAKSVLTSGQSGLTRAGDIVGTVSYMSPEQIQSSMTVDHRSDIYSLGATLYYMLAGKPPFSSGAFSPEFFRRVLVEDPPPLHMERRDIPPIVSAMVMKCLRKHPGERYQAAGEIVKFVDQMLAPFEEKTTSG
jgi:serine/threonine protein kinase